MTKHLLAAFLLIFQCPAFCLELPEACVTVQVVGEDGNPIQDAEAVVVFSGAAEKDPKAHDEFGVKGLTDANGKFTAIAKARAWFDYIATKQGYYRTQNAETYMFKDIEENRLVPWNPTLQLVLKKIGNPVPMYARERTVQMPVEDQKVGFDLQICDWVAPYGKGVNNDFMFCFEKRPTPNGNVVKYTLSFSNKNDGIQPVEAKLGLGSKLELPRFAPDNGYLGEWIIREGDENIIRNTSPTQNRSYFFRVRSAVVDENIKALYGKIRGDFGCGGYRRGLPKITFTYYLNPDGTRNMEFDTEKNLTKGMKSFEVIPWP